MNSDQDDPITINSRDVRAGRIVRGGAIGRMLITSTIVVVIALVIAYLASF